MSPDEFAAKMIEIFLNKDLEAGHASADELMLQVLGELGYNEGCQIFREADKWYA